MREWTAVIEVDAERARRLIGAQFRQLELGSLRLVAEGWDNTVWLVDERWAFRFPRRAIAVPGVERELAVLHCLAPLLPLPIPTPVFHGRPADGYPWPFLGSPFLPGREACDADLGDAARLGVARPLAIFLRALHSAAVVEAVAHPLPVNPLGRADMVKRVPRTRERLAEVERLGIWSRPASVERLLDVAELLPTPESVALVHGDLHFRHLLVDESGALSGVIDWGDVCRAPASVDLQIVWSFFPADGRTRFLDAYGPVAEDELIRARVLALFVCASLASYGHHARLENVEREAVAGLVRAAGSRAEKRPASRAGQPMTGRLYRRASDLLTRPTMLGQAHSTMLSEISDVHFDSGSEFDFRLPFGAYGWSSGWRTSRPLDMRWSPDLAPRRTVILKETGRSVFLPFRNGELRTPKGLEQITQFTFMRKIPSTETTGERGFVALSSGSGSALFRVGDRIFKMKRCGFMDRGFVDPGYRTHMTLDQAGEHFDTTETALAGVMSLVSAITECRLTYEFVHHDLCAAYTPVGVVVVTDLPDAAFGDVPVGAVVVEVHSELRMDELACMSLSPLLADLAGSGRLKYDADTGFYDADGIPLSATARRWQVIAARLEHLGYAAGAALRRVHDAGYFRGFANCWFGNDVVDESGVVSTVDFDGGTERYDSYDPELAHRIRRLEFDRYCTYTHISLTRNRPKSVAWFGTVLLDAVRRAYEDGGMRASVPPDVIQDVIADHSAVWPIVCDLLHFQTELPERT